MAKIQVKVFRYDTNNGGRNEFETYEIEKNEKSTILEALLQIYESHDSTLAFAYGCRVKNCGLCAVNVNGKPHFACITEVEDGMEISSLENVPLVKDLVFDRKPFFDFLNQFRVYLVRQSEAEVLPEVMIQPREHSMLMSCRECFGCMSVCPKYNDADESFGGPLAFVKLAQLHYDCRDSLDRPQQAKEMGVTNCNDCKGCACISGIPINKIVIKPFLELLNTKREPEE